MALYIYKILNEMTSEITGNHSSDVPVTESLRRGRLCTIPKINQRAPTSLQTLLEGSLQMNLANFFNSLPRSQSVRVGFLLLKVAWRILEVSTRLSKPPSLPAAVPH